MITTLTPPVEELSADAVAERVFTASLAGLEALSVYIGDRLGWYRSLREDGPATPGELSERTGTHPRYAREWLEQQAVMGLLHAEPASSAEERRYLLPAGAAEALTDGDSLAYPAPLPRMLAAIGRQLPELLDAYRSGDGVSWDELGADARESQADLNRPWFLQSAGRPPGRAGGGDGRGGRRGVHRTRDDVERFMYAVSLFICLPDGMSSTPSAGTGTVMRPATLAGYAENAGFAAVDVLPIPDFSFFRFYRLR